jgi:uncharacterized membrane protein
LEFEDEGYLKNFVVIFFVKVFSTVRYFLMQRFFWQKNNHDVTAIFVFVLQICLLRT